MVISCPFQSRCRIQIRFVSVQFGILIITLSYELGFECSYTLWKACAIIYNFVNSEIVQKNRYQGVICIGLIPLDRRLSPDLPRGTVNLIGGELDVDDPRLRTNRTPQSLHHCSIGYHPCHTNDLATKAYPCKCNQEHKQEQEMQSNRLDYEMGSHKPMNGDTV
jgi:hypothetical protein